MPTIEEVQAQVNGLTQRCVDQDRKIESLTAKAGSHDTCIALHQAKLGQLEASLALTNKEVAEVKEIEAPLTLVQHFWQGVVSPVFGHVKAVVKSVYPGLLAAAIILLALHHSGCVPIPLPPGPTPTPVPPVPPAPPAPIPLKGFRVLIMYDKDTLTADQQGIVFGATVRKYLDTKCVVGEDGKTPDRRIYAYGVDASGEAQWIRDVIQKHPGQKSWMVVSDGVTGYDGPLPMNADEALKILQKVGG